MLWNSSFDELVSTTLKNYAPRMTDNITDQNVVLWALEKQGFIEEREGGTTIVEPLMTGENATVNSFSGYDTIDTSATAGISAAEQDWKQIAATVSISGIEQFKNGAGASKTQVVSLLKNKILQTEKSLMLYMNEKLLGDGTGNSSKDIVGLALAVEDGAAWSTYGGIDSNANSRWRNRYYGTVGSWAANGEAKLRTLFNDCTRGKDMPELILCGQAVHEAFEKELSGALHYMTSDLEMAKAGFRNFQYKGAPVVWDADMQTSYAGYMYTLQPKYLKFVYGKGRKFALSEWQKPDNQDAKIAQVFVYGNLVCNNRRLQGVLTGITVP